MERLAVAADLAIMAMTVTTTGRSDGKIINQKHSCEINKTYVLCQNKKYILG